MTTPITTHYTLEDLTHTGTGLPNVPDADQTVNLTALAVQLLEPIRVAAGNPVEVESAFRSPAVNAAVGGGPESPHLQGDAADIRPVEPEDYVGLWVAVLDVARSATTLDQAIVHEDRHHIQVIRKADGARGELLVQPLAGSPVPWKGYDGALAREVEALVGPTPPDPAPTPHGKTGCLGRLSWVKVGAVIAGVVVGIAIGLLSEEHRTVVAGAALEVTGVADMCRDVLPQCQVTDEDTGDTDTDTDLKANGTSRKEKEAAKKAAKEKEKAEEKAARAGKKDTDDTDTDYAGGGS